uniref:SERPIN domain-containing protein n=1 Tax=Trichuris muris TaxID=70415 RepID=A0A5S6QHF5_TRIMR
MDEKQLQPVVEFIWNLYRNSSSVSKTSSVFLSPLSIVNVLCMAYIGAAGETKDQMRNVMFGDFANEDQLRSLFVFLVDLLSPSKQRNKEYTLNGASRLYCQSGFEILKTFTDQLEKLFKSDLVQLDFAESEKSRGEINSWVSSRTSGKIEQLIPPGVLGSLTRLVLVNAVYFKGDWAAKFPADRTINAPFYLSATYQVQTAMMTDKRKFRYTEDDNCQVLGIAYKGNELELYIILPKKRFQMEQFENQLTGEQLQNLFRRCSTCEVTATIPKFKLEHSFRVKPALQHLGIADMFDCSKANFSEITKNPELCVSEFLHKAFVEVNEEGTEAAAASAAVLMNRSAMTQLHPLYFVADHSFLFAIVELDNYMPLFIGRYYGPSTE